jgi:putative FmdB family regulatory protein
MPIYEYRCEHGHTFEVMQRITDDPVSTCQLCEAPVERVFHPVAVHFKGSGFYTTDYGNRKRQRSEGGEGDTAASEKASEKKEKKEKKSEKPSSSSSAEKAAA